MNFHIMIDDKFIETFMNVAEKVSPGKNVYVFTFELPGKFVKNNHGVSAPYGSPQLKQIFERITGNDRVFVHWFDERILPYLDHIPRSVALYLFLWGGDFLEQTRESRKLNYGPLTESLIRNREWHLKYDRPLPVRLLKMGYNLLTNEAGARKLNKRKWNSRHTFLTRLNFMCHWNKDDSDVISKLYDADFGFLPFFYHLTLPDDNSLVHSGSADRNVIWLGNSATPTNNHLEVFSLLERYQANDWELHVPLSYGQSWYADEISKTGSRKFGEKFFSLRSFIPLQDYMVLMREVDVVIMNHHRSQAAGNIFAFVYMGKKVYLSKHSTIFSMMKREGIVVFAVEDIAVTSFANFMQPLSATEKLKNSEKIGALFSEKRCYELLGGILN